MRTVMFTAAVALTLVAGACAPASGGAPTIDDGSGITVVDASLPDENPTSPRFGDEVRSTDYLGQRSAWYFGHAT